MPKTKEPESEEIIADPSDVIEHGEIEVYAGGTEIAVRPPGNLFGTVDDPEATIEKATRHAKALASVIENQKLYTDIQGKKHVRVEGWTLLGSMLGVFPVMIKCEPVMVRDRTDPAGTSMVEGYEAVVEAVTFSGAVVGRAKAYCLRNERRWKSADDYAVASMAQTRATSKSLRNPLGFIMQLAGYNPTPAEEIPVSVAAPRSQRMRQRIEQLCREADKAGERQPGTTWAELLDQSKLHFEAEVSDLGEEDLKTVGMALSRYKEQVEADHDMTFEITGGDVAFGDTFGDGGYE